MKKEKNKVAKKIILCTALMSAALFIFAQQITHEAVVVNIEVQVRVFRGAKFIGDLTKNDFLIYYSPKDYTMDGKFKKIEVKVKDKNYRITHRQGYFAN